MLTEYWNIDLLEESLKFPVELSAVSWMRRGVSRSFDLSDFMKDAKLIKFTKDFLTEIRIKEIEESLPDPICERGFYRFVGFMIKVIQVKETN
jgi:hypothetical protein